jgi:pimeloyl-ACP methyl ester carboxylesterase
MNSNLRMALGLSLAILLSLMLTACGGDIIGSPVVKATLTTTQLDAMSAGFGSQPLSGKATCSVTMAQINYETSGVQPSEVTNASAAILIPGGARCPGPFPLIGFARGTNLSKSHTNADPADPTADLLMTFFAAQGYVVVATDYLGYALSAYPYHPYMHADSEASAVIDSIRATRRAALSLGLALNGKVMLSGYSQGGHAAMAAQRAIERENTGEFNLVAAAHSAGPYYVSAALIEGAKYPIHGVQEFVPFQITAFQKVYGNVYSKTSDVFNSPYDGYIENLLPTVLNLDSLAQMLPGGTPFQAQQLMFQPAYLNDLAYDSNNATVVAAKKQDLLGWNPKAPTTLCGGSGDPTVSFFTNAQAVYNDFKSRGGANVSLVDVDSEIRQTFGGMDSVTYGSDYHGVFEPPFCAQVAKQFFDLHK